MLHINRLTYYVSDRFTVGPIDLVLRQGTHLALMGESGCGKTTLLKLIHGLLDRDGGHLSWNSHTISGPSEHLVPGMPWSKYLAQDFDLMPYTTVRENIHKHLSRLEPEASEARASELMEVVEMSSYAHVKVKTLSGGQQQRVALAQTLAKEPQLLLLDEPFSHIDNFRKNKLRRQLFAYLKKQHITCIIATHDSTDVLAFMDETAVLKEGKLIAHGTTSELYTQPPSIYIGSLFDDINVIPSDWFDLSASEGDSLYYPHQLEISSRGVEATVVRSYFLGSH